MLTPQAAATIHSFILFKSFLYMTIELDASRDSCFLKILAVQPQGAGAMHSTQHLCQNSHPVQGPMQVHPYMTLIKFCSDMDIG